MRTKLLLLIISVLFTGSFLVKGAIPVQNMEDPCIVENETKQMPLNLSELVEKKQAVIGLDNWFNREYHKKTGKSYHYLWTDTAQSGFSELGDIFKEKGAVLKTIEQNPTPEILNNLDVYIIVDPDSTSETKNPNYILQDDINAITNWVKEGGVLLMMANNGPQCEFIHYNKLAGSFGFQFIPVSLHPVPNDDWETGAETNLPNHPLFKGVDKIFFKNTASIKRTGNSQPILKDGKDILITETSFGKGKVIAVVDPWIYNEYIHHQRLPKSFQNKKAAYNLVDYLLAK
jgi:unsaturated rhamnogalacturonyl hydrolase